MQALATLVEPFCKIWPCGAIFGGAIGAVIGAIITYLVMVYGLKYRKLNKV